MKKLPLLQVDAFTARPYGGNPCAVVFGADELSPKAMQAIAKEMNLSETAFVMKSTVADLRARYFTPASEIPLAGHPTIATIYALLQTSRLKLQQLPFRLQLQLQAGVITVEVSGTMEKPLITMFQPAPEFLTIYDPETILPAFGLTKNDLLPGAPVMTVSTGTPQLMLPLAGMASLRRATMQVDKYRSVYSGGDFFSPHLFVLSGFNERGQTFARHFGLPPDTFEDPFTGSATGGMAAYLWHHKLMPNPRFIAQQGHLMGRPGEAFVEVVGSPENIETVKVGGYAAMVMSGEIVIPEDEK